jgi:hypothetical protein
MNPKNLILILAIFSSFIITNCESETKNGDLNPVANNDINPVAKDSIYYKDINIELYNVSFESLDIENDKAPDLNFEIINLNDYNPNPLPEDFDTLAARVYPILSNEILDNSTFGYPTALNLNDSISSKGFWSNKTGVLGTFQNAGQFQGQGEKYLGFRKYINEKYYYGWIKIDCSQHSDTLKILEFGYNLTSDKGIRAGQID